MVRLLLGLLCVVHGVPHLVGFFAAWRPSAIPELPHKTTVLSGRVDLGEVGIRVLGVGWLLLALAFIGAACLFWFHVPQATGALLSLAIISFVFSLVAWPDSQIGVVVNLIVILLVLAVVRYGWL